MDVSCSSIFIFLIDEILCSCGNRFVLFDNKTNDETKKSNQVNQLLSHVNMVLEKNGGEPYTNEIFTEIKNDMGQRRDTSRRDRGFCGGICHRFVSIYIKNGVVKVAYRVRLLACGKIIDHRHAQLYAYRDPSKFVVAAPAGASSGGGASASTEEKKKESAEESDDDIFD
ncbi:hypothetical protein OSB04_005239 [Centaurea solstitialis]|uniref:AIG1-type G domain-containing protein n=1 Tax=Centaurea solstitialis TaxID=347529 RepID=A0AA38THE2_9ASTR|nr:hypothetical protein OSB04_005239 [Centaurea solstitialis]